MQENLNDNLEQKTEYKSPEALPYLRETKNELPNDYDANVKKLQQKLESNEQVETIQKFLLVLGGGLSFYLLLSAMTNWIGYPLVVVFLMKMLALAEGAIPLTISFFIKNKRYATIMRAIGVIVLTLYLYLTLWVDFF